MGGIPSSSQEPSMPAQPAAFSSSTPPAARAVHARTAWMKTLDDAAQDRRGEAGRGGTVVHFAQDREIYAEGDEAETVYKVVSGVVRTCKFLSDGRRQIDAFYVAGDVFGFEAGP